MNEEEMYKTVEDILGGDLSLVYERYSNNESDFVEVCKYLGIDHDSTTKLEFTKTTSPHNNHHNIKHIGSVFTANDIIELHKLLVTTRKILYDY